MQNAFKYTRGDVAGLGFLTTFGAVPVHVVAWDNGQIERLRDHEDFLRDIEVKPLFPLPETVAVSTQESNASPWADWNPTEGESEAASIRAFLTQFGADLDSKAVVEALGSKGLSVSASQVNSAKKAIASAAKE